MKERIKGWLLNKRTGRTEWVVLALWLALVCVIRHFHEPWFDETQAWQIARFASLREVLAEVPHYEGHPPLWHLLLLPFARAELPYKLTIFCVNIAFSGTAVFLMLFRSPFPRWLRCYLPFTYYTFYLQGVHTRPYCMMLLALILAAMAYPRRNERPGRYVLSLIFLCLTSAFGVIFAFGFCLVWTGELLAEYRTRGTIAGVHRDRRLWWLVLIAAVGVLVYVSVRPAPDVSVGLNSGRDSLFHPSLKRLHYIPLLFFDSTIGAVLLEDKSVESPVGHILGAVVGLVMLAAFLLLLHRNRKMWLFAVPYLIGALFNTMVWFSVHQIEVYELLIIFILWVLFSDRVELPAAFGWIRSKLDSRLTILLMKVAAFAALCAPVVFTVGASFLELRYCYGPKEITDFIKAHKLEDRRILIRWNYLLESKDDADDFMANIILDETLPAKLPSSIKWQETLLTGLPSAVYADFDRDADFFRYFNNGESQQKWMIWRTQTEEETAEVFRLWREEGLPDFIIGTVPLQAVYPEAMLDGVTYYWVGNVHYGKICKLDYTGECDHIYIRGDLLEEYPELEVYTYLHSPE